MSDTFDELLPQICSALSLSQESKMSEGRADQKRGKARRKAGKRITFRVTDEEYNWVVQEAKGKASVSAFVHSKVFGAGMRNHDVLRQVAALHHLGMNAKALAERPGMPTVEVEATLASAQNAIAKLAKDLP